MHFFILVLLISFFIFLFFLHFVSRDDIVLMRRNISEDNIFNIAFLLLVVAVLSSRFFYVLLNPSENFLNPLYFLLFPYFPGLSLLGGVVGGSIFLYSIFKIKKMPTARLLDLFALSFLSSMPFGAVGYYILSDYSILSFSAVFTAVSYVLLFLFFVFFLFPRFAKGRVEEGNMAILFLIAFSVVSLLRLVVEKRFALDLENVILALLLIFSTGIYIKKTKLIPKFIASRKKP